MSHRIAKPWLTSNIRGNKIQNGQVSYYKQLRNSVNYATKKAYFNNEFRDRQARN